MIKQAFHLTSIFVVMCLSLYGQIVEVDRFDQVASYLTEDTLLILDIDDTLLLPVQMLGCDEWFKERLKFYQMEGHPADVALDKALAQWEAIRHLTQMRLVEPGSDEVVRSLQRQGITLIGLTTQGLALATRTVNQLKQYDLDLSLTAPTHKEYYVEADSHAALYRKGVLFTSGTHKGRALFAFLDAINYLPKRIVFLNDKSTHLIDIEDTSKQRGIEYIGLRYAYADLHKSLYKKEIADVQFRYSTIESILSDEEALKYFEKK